jgi:hypothetical protein
MAIQRQGNWLGNMRVDVPHLRLVEAAIAGDFQALSGTFMTGTKALVAWGAAILDTGVTGTPASSLILRMASAVLLHGTASEAGCIFTVSPLQADDVLNGTNTNVVGSFTPGTHQVNYVGLDLVRLSDPGTQDAVVFRSSSGAEFTQVVPLARVLKYRIHITTSDFSSNPTFCPIAKVVTDSFGNVEQVIDCRQMFWRLGTGGTTPNAVAQFTWSNRNENTSSSGFTGGDKDLQSQSDFNRAVMQRLWELGGGEHWYAPASERSVQLTYDNTAVFPATGENWQWTGTDLLWRGLSYWFANSTATENPVTDVTVATPGLTDIADGQLLYVELNRTTNATITPVKATWGSLFALAESTPGSRHILAWRQHGRVFVGQQSTVVNTGGTHATNTSFGTVKLLTAYAPDPSNPLVPTLNAGNQVVAGGVMALTSASQTFTSNLVAGSTSTDFLYNTSATRSAGKLAEWQNNGTTKAQLDFAGNFAGTSGAFGDIFGSGTIISISANGIQSSFANKTNIFMLSQLVAGSAGVDFLLASFTNRSAGLLFAIQRNFSGLANTVFDVDFNGAVRSDTTFTAGNATTFADTSLRLATKGYVDSVAPSTTPVQGTGNAAPTPGAGTYADATGVAATITVPSIPNGTNRGVLIVVQPLAGGIAQLDSNNNSQILARIVRDGVTTIADWTMGAYGSSTALNMPVNLVFIDKNPPAGSRSYKLQLQTPGGFSGVGVANINMVVALIGA